MQTTVMIEVLISFMDYIQHLMILDYFWLKLFEPKTAELNISPGILEVENFKKTSEKFLKVFLFLLTFQ